MCQELWMFLCISHLKYNTVNPINCLKMLKRLRDSYGFNLWWVCIFLRATTRENICALINVRTQTEVCAHPTKAMWPIPHYVTDSCCLSRHDASEPEIPPVWSNSILISSNLNLFKRAGTIVSLVQLFRVTSHIHDFFTFVSGDMKSEEEATVVSFLSLSFSVSP